MAIEKSPTQRTIGWQLETFYKPLSLYRQRLVAYYGTRPGPGWRGSRYAPESNLVRHYDDKSVELPTGASAGVGSDYAASDGIGSNG